MSYVLAIHGGAGTIRPGELDESPYHLGLRQALEAGEMVLKAGGTALDAVVATIAALENCPLFNAGLGSVLTSAETHEMDAGLMDGDTLRAGAVAGVRHIRNPILAAKAVLDDGRFVLLGAEGADRFATDSGLQPVANQYFTTPKRLADLRALQKSQPGRVALDHSTEQALDQAKSPEFAAHLADVSRFGTVGAVALDIHGHLAAGASTGGMTNKTPGRIGDTPLIGAGVYANDASCAISATGTGEHFIRACVGYDLHARMRYGGKPLAEAAQAVIDESLGAIGGEGGFIAIGRDGSLAMPFNSRGMYRGWVRSGQAMETAIFR